MKKLLTVPTVMFPYIIICYAILFNFEVPIAHKYADCIGWFFLAWGILSVICNIIFICIKKEDTPLKLLKTALCIKLFQLPAYILIFIVGLFMGLMFFMTFPLILFLVLIDLITLWLGNMISIYALFRFLKENRNSGGVTAPIIITFICQFFFCLDVIILFVTYLSLKASYKRSCLTEK